MNTWSYFKLELALKVKIINNQQVSKLVKVRLHKVSFNNSTSKKRISQ